MKAISARFCHNLGGFTLEAALFCPCFGVTALSGPSGCGKTTLMRCIAGLEKASVGYLEVNGEVWQDSERGVFLPPHLRSVGYVFQHANLFPHLTVRRNLEYGWKRAMPGLRGIYLEKIADMLGLRALMERYPGNLSGGERQRAAIARALLSSPKLLLMDEPLSGLDAASKKEIHPCLEHLRNEFSTPVLYVSHDPLEITRVADHLVLMENGRISAMGCLNDILTRLDLAPAREERAMSVVDARVAAHEDEYGLSSLEFSGGQLLLPHVAGSPGQPVRVGIMARDVSLALKRHEDTSILNIFPARVLEVSAEMDGHVLARLDAGGAVILSRVTRKSSAALGLKAGLSVFAQVKSVAILS